MKIYRKSLISVAILSVCANVYAETFVAPPERLGFFRNLHKAIPGTETFAWIAEQNFSRAEATKTKGLNPIKIIKMTDPVRQHLGTNIPEMTVPNIDPIMSIKKTIVATSITLGQIDYLQISEIGYRWTAQCVAFAKALTGKSTGTNNWYAGDQLGNIPIAELDTKVIPGTMIAFFDGYKTYNGSDRHHVAIFLEFEKDSTGKPTGMFVIDQNFINGYSTKINEVIFTRDNFSKADFNPIAIHRFAWTDSGGNHLSAT